MSNATRERWIRYSAPSTSAFTHLYYCSANRGISREQTNEEITYWGALFPAADTDDPSLPTPHRFTHELTTILHRLPDHIMPLPNGVSERYVYRDTRTQHDMVLWRIPMLTSATPTSGSLRSRVSAWTINQGITQQALQQPVTYWGRTSQVPSHVMDAQRDDGMTPYQRNPEHLAAEVTERHSTVYKGVLERYETWDIATGDLLIVWRIPAKIDD